MDKEQFLESGLLEQYVLGLTNAEESAEVESYAAAFPEVQKEINSLRTSLKAYAKDQLLASPQDLKAPNLNEVDELAHVRTPNRRNIRLYAAVALVLLSTVMASLYFFLQYHHQKEAYDRLQNEFEVFQEICQSTKKELALSTQKLEFVNHPATQPVYLKGTNLDPKAAAVVYWNPEAQNALLSVLNLPPPPSEKQYQIWADVDGKMVNMGVFDRDHHQLQVVNFIKQPDSFNITLEPKGGSDHPNTNLLYANGKI